jgi:hypothetical protein
MTGAGRFRCDRRDDCRICGATGLIDYLDLGAQPPSNSFIVPEDVAGEQRFPLTVALCPGCGNSQLRDVVAAADIFEDYLYLSSTSCALVRHYQGLVERALAMFEPATDALAVDIGCNDGILLKGYPEGRVRTLGIEPSSAAGHARAAGFEVVEEFFDGALARRLADSHGRAAIVTATNVFAHVDDIASFAAGVAALLDDGGVFIIEFPYLVDTVDRLYFDTVYHEHLSYLALSPLRLLFEGAGLRAFRVERQEIGASGPALRLFVCRAGSSHREDDSIPAMLRAEEKWGIADIARYRDFAERVGGASTELRRLIDNLRSDGHSVGGFGAPAKGNTLLNTVGFGPDDIACISDNNTLKIGKLTPGSHIPIVSDADFLAAKISHALLLAWNYLDFFLDRAEFIRRGGKFVVPLPRPEIRP